MTQQTDFLLREKDHGHSFLWRETTNPWALAQGLSHEIEVRDGLRFANVLKTVAHVAVDEAADGSPVLEKWQITQSWGYPA